MVALETSIALPETASVVETAPALLPIRGFGNGIDLVIDSPTEPQLYEENCFKYLIRSNPTLFGIGPHLLDHAFIVPSLFVDSRPDALLLSHGEDGLVLVELSEFKSNKTNGFHKKIAGFSRLMDKLRADESLLPEALNDTLEDAGIYNFLFSKITIPPDSSMDVSFISPIIEMPAANEKDLPFNVKHLVVPKNGITHHH